MACSTRTIGAANPRASQMAFSSRSIANPVTWYSAPTDSSKASECGRIGQAVKWRGHSRYRHQDLLTAPRSQSPVAACTKTTHPGPSDAARSHRSMSAALGSSRPAAMRRKVVILRWCSGSRNIQPPANRRSTKSGPTRRASLSVALACAISLNPT